MNFKKATLLGLALAGVLVYVRAAASSDEGKKDVAPREESNPSTSLDKPPCDKKNCKGCKGCEDKEPCKCKEGEDCKCKEEGKECKCKAKRRTKNPTTRKRNRYWAVPT